MNFESFLPSELSQALNRELEIMKEAATSGTMDVSYNRTRLIMGVLPYPPRDSNTLRAHNIAPLLTCNTWSGTRRAKGLFHLAAEQLSTCRVCPTQALVEDADDDEEDVGAVAASISKAAEVPQPILVAATAATPAAAASAFATRASAGGGSISDAEAVAAALEAGGTGSAGAVASRAGLVVGATARKPKRAAFMATAATLKPTAQSAPPPVPSGRGFDDVGSDRCASVSKWLDTVWRAS